LADHKTDRGSFYPELEEKRLAEIREKENPNEAERALLSLLDKSISTKSDGKSNLADTRLVDWLSELPRWFIWNWRGRMV
jgi:hypothetical protein